MASLVLRAHHREWTGRLQDDSGNEMFDRLFARVIGRKALAAKLRNHVAERQITCQHDAALGNECRDGAAAGIALRLGRGAGGRGRITRRRSPPSRPPDVELIPEGVVHHLWDADMSYHDHRAELALVDAEYLS